MMLNFLIYGLKGEVGSDLDIPDKSKRYKESPLVNLVTILTDLYRRAIRHLKKGSRLLQEKTKL